MAQSVRRCELREASSSCVALNLVCMATTEEITPITIENDQQSKARYEDHGCSFGSNCRDENDWLLIQDCQDNAQQIFQRSAFTHDVTALCQPFEPGQQTIPQLFGAWGSRGR